MSNAVDAAASQSPEATGAGPSSTARGTYGVRLVGFEDCDSLGTVPDEAPPWRIAIDSGANRLLGEPEHITADSALLHFGDGSSAQVSRESPGGSVRLFLSRDVSRCDLAHPYLSVTGMLNAYWGDGLGLHAGAVVIDGRAWVIVAAKGGGKTTSLALLDRAGHPVLADDLSVVGPQLQVHRGPRFLDLRREVAERLAIGEDRGFIGMRRRWRYRIRDAPLTAPLGGVVVPVWGDAFVDPVQGAGRLEVLAPSVSIRVPGRWEVLVAGGGVIGAGDGVEPSSPSRGRRSRDRPAARRRRRPRVSVAAPPSSDPSPCSGPTGTVRWSGCGAWGDHGRD